MRLKSKKQNLCISTPFLSSAFYTSLKEETLACAPEEYTVAIHSQKVNDAMKKAKELVAQQKASIPRRAKRNRYFRYC